MHKAGAELGMAGELGRQVLEVEAAALDRKRSSLLPMLDGDEFSKLGPFDVNRSMRTGQPASQRMVCGADAPRQVGLLRLAH